jgi:hypothetical protein
VQIDVNRRRPAEDATRIRMWAAREIILGDDEGLIVSCRARRATTTGPMSRRTMRVGSTPAEDLPSPIGVHGVHLAPHAKPAHRPVHRRPADAMPALAHAIVDRLRSQKVERWFSALTTKKLQRGAHRSVKALAADIQSSVATRKLALERPVR